MARHQDIIARLFERGAASVAYVAANSIWLFAIPILAIFILRDGGQIAETIIEATKSRGDATRMGRILRHVDKMLAKYIRAQLALAGLSFVFYSVSMLVLGFPDAIALGLLGGVLEFLPAVGWIVSAGGYFDDRLSDTFTLDLDGGVADCLEARTGLCELPSYHGWQLGTTAPDGRVRAYGGRTSGRY